MRRRRASRTWNQATIAAANATPAVTAAAPAVTQSNHPACTFTSSVTAMTLATTCLSQPLRNAAVVGTRAAMRGREGHGAVRTDSHRLGGLRRISLGANVELHLRWGHIRRRRFARRRP